MHSDVGDLRDLRAAAQRMTVQRGEHRAETPRADPETNARSPAPVATGARAARAVGCAPGSCYRTGDVGMLDADSYLTINDRKSDAIIRAVRTSARSKSRRY